MHLARLTDGINYESDSAMIKILTIAVIAATLAGSAYAAPKCGGGKFTDNGFLEFYDPDASECTIITPHTCDHAADAYIKSHKWFKDACDEVMRQEN